MKVAGTLRIGRTILVAVLAVAVGILPAAVSTVRATPAAVTTVTAVQSEPYCDHQRRDVPSKQTQDTVKHETCVVGCALCFVFVDTDVSVVAYSVPFNTALKPLRASTAISSLMGSPPFRPPRA